MGNDGLTVEDLEVDDSADELEEEEIEDEEDEDELSGDEEDLDAATPADDKSLSTKEVATRMAELEASNKGLVKSLSAQREIRQELQKDLMAIKQMLSQVNSNPVKTTEEEEDLEDDIVKVEFDEDGNPFVHKDDIKHLQSDEVTKLQTELRELKQTTISMLNRGSDQEALDVLLAEKEGYSEAHKAITGAWKYLNKEFDIYLDEEGLAKPTSSDQAIDMVLGSESLTKAFTTKYPTLNLESILEAQLTGSPRYLRKALNSAIIEPSSTHEKLDSTKPASLSSANTTGGDSTESLLDRVADMSPEDFAKLDTTTMSKIDKLLEQFG